MASVPSWSDLPLDLLDLVVARLPCPADRARSRAVCRSWHSAVRRHGHQLPWIVDMDGDVSTLSDGGWHRMPSVPDNTICVGSSDEWLALGFFHMADWEDSEGQYYVIDSYLLHNGFSNTSIPLPELDCIVREDKRIRKFRVRSTADDFVIAAITTSRKHPLVVIRPGKGVWLPERTEEGYVYIIDIAFLGDTLYAITRAEELIPLYLTSDADGRPIVTMGRRVIKDNHGVLWWPASDDEGEDVEAAGVDDEDHNEAEQEPVGVDDEDDDEAEQEEEPPGVDGEDDDEAEQEEELDDEDDDEAELEEGVAGVDDGDNAEQEENGNEEGPAAGNDEDGNELDVDDTNYLNCPNVCTSNGELIYWHLVESCGKLLMVRPHLRILPDYSIVSFCPVDIFEADMDTHAWVPMVNGVGGGRALFMGLEFSKSVSAPRGEVEEDAIYFVHSGEVFNTKTQTCNPQRFCEPSKWLQFRELLFPPELVL